MSDAPVIITHSDISQFLTCRRQWHYNYVLDYRPPERPTGPLALGSRVHAALEAWYSGVTDDPVAWIDAKGKEDLAALDYDNNAKPWDEKQMYEDMVVGRNCLKLYMEWLDETGADDNYRTVAVEEKVEVPILGGRAILRGKVDLLKEDITSGLMCADDFKTTGDWGGGLREQLERSYQHWCYLIGLQHNYPDRNVECSQYTVLRKVKKIPAAPKVPLIQRFTVPATRRAIGAKRAQIDRIATEMLALKDKTDPAIFYPSPSRACSWCDYKSPCDIADESSPETVLAMLGSGHYVQGTRYDRYRDKEQEASDA